MRRLASLSLCVVAVFGWASVAAAADRYAWTNFVGQPSGYGDADGPGSVAQFRHPSGVGVDSAGNVYVADTYNHTIRKVTPAGEVTTLAGKAGSSGSTDGTGSAARFNGPHGVAVDSAGNVYVADKWNNTIRKVTPAGEVTILAGLAGSSGSADGTGSTARFNWPEGVAVDSAGNVYVADEGNKTIRKVTPAGEVTTLAGKAGSSGSTDGTGSAARFGTTDGGPTGVGVDSAGNVYVADFWNDTIRKVTPGGEVTTLAGQAGVPGSVDGAGSVARFSWPTGVAVDSVGNVYVADGGGQTIRKVTSAGDVTTLAGQAGSYGSTDGTGNAARFGSLIVWATGVVVDSTGNVYVGDSGNDNIRKVTPAGVVTTLAGLAGGSSGSVDGTGSAARFSGPSGVAVDGAGNVYVADGGNHTIRKVTSSGVVTTLAGLARSYGSSDGTGSAARFTNPSGVAVDSAGNVYVADCGNHTIRKVTPGGVATTLAGLAWPAGGAGSTDGTGSAARFYNPSGVAVDSAGNVYVADSVNGMVRKVTPSGVVTTLAARSWQPQDVAVDSVGNVYVAGGNTDAVHKVTPSGVGTTLAGLWGWAGSADGTGSAARFSYPEGVAVDSAGNVYVADSGSHTIRKVTASRVVTTIGGTPYVAGVADGVGRAAIFWCPSGIAVDSVGNLYVADFNNNRISKGTPLAAGDTDGDGYVNVSDLQILVAAWGSQAGPPASANWNAAADLTSDGFINVGDLQVLVANWGRS